MEEILFFMVPRRIGVRISGGDVDAGVDCGGLGIAVSNEPKDGFKQVVVGCERGGEPHLEDGGARGEREAGKGGPGPTKYKGANPGAVDSKFVRDGIILYYMKGIFAPK